MNRHDIPHDADVSPLSRRWMQLVRTPLVRSLVFLALTPLGCLNVGPDHEPPRVAAPGDFDTELGRGLSNDAADVAEWWTLFNDPILDQLVRDAVGGNHDVRIAVARVTEAWGLRGVSAGEQYPSIDADGSHTRTRISSNNDTPVFVGFPVKQDVDRISLGASWEVDFWGRVRRSLEAADAKTDALVEDLRDVQVTLVAEVAARYVDLRERQRRLEIARSNLTIQESTLHLVQVRFDTGIGDELAVAQARANVAQTRAAIPTLEASMHEAAHAIGVLLGLRPDELPPSLYSRGTIPRSPPKVAIGVPADLLRRRPDLRRAEREIAAQSARIGVAVANQYPRVELLGTIGRESGHVNQLFDSGSEVYSLGPSIHWPLFAGGALKSQIDVEEARLEQQRLRYEAAALDAYREAADAVFGFLREHERREALEAAVRDVRNAVEKSESLYREGLVDFQNVLDNQRTLFRVEEDLAISEATIAQRAITLFRELGGGWQTTPFDATTPSR